MIQLAKDSPTGLYFTNQLGNTYADDSKNNNGSIIIWFIDVITVFQVYHKQQIAHKDAETEQAMKADDILTNTGNDPDINTTIRIIGVNNNNEDSIQQPG